MYLGSYWRTSGGWHCLYTLSLLQSRALLSLEGELYMWLMPYFLYLIYIYILYCSGFCIWYPGDVSWLPGFGGQGVYIPGSPETVIIREMALAYSTLQMEDQNMLPLFTPLLSFFEKGLFVPFVYLGTLAWGTGFRFGILLVDYGAALKECSCQHHFGALSLPCSSLPVITQ